MKKFFLFLLFFFAAGFAIARFLPALLPIFGKAEPLFPKVLDLGFRPAPFPIENHPFVIVVIGKNNGASVEKTLQSIFSQHYDNFRIIYIDDASNDGSFELARDLIYDSAHLARVTLARNEESLGSFANVFRAVQTAAGEEIVVVLQGEDRLAHEWVLQRLNQYYADPDLWLAFGQYREIPTLKLGDSSLFLEEWQKRGMLGVSSPSSHLTTFYASLFQKIRESDLAGGIAYLPLMLEMAQNHCQYIPETLYLSAPTLRGEL